MIFLVHHTKSNTKTNTKMKTKTKIKCRKDYTCGIFSKSRGCKDIKHDILSASPEHHTKTETKTKTKTKYRKY